MRARRRLQPELEHRIRSASGRRLKRTIQARRTVAWGRRQGARPRCRFEATQHARRNPEGRRVLEGAAPMRSPVVARTRPEDAHRRADKRRSVLSRRERPSDRPVTRDAVQRTGPAVDEQGPSGRYRTGAARAMDLRCVDPQPRGLRRAPLSATAARDRIARAGCPTERKRREPTSCEKEVDLRPAGIERHARRRSDGRSVVDG